MSDITKRNARLGDRLVCKLASMNYDVMVAVQTARMFHVSLYRAIDLLLLLHHSSKQKLNQFLAKGPREQAF